MQTPGDGTIAVPFVNGPQEEGAHLADLLPQSSIRQRICRMLEPYTEPLFYLTASEDLTSGERRKKPRRRWDVQLAAPSLSGRVEFTTIEP